MNSIFKKPSTSSKRGRNGFDLSFRRLFTAPCGMMLPVVTEFTLPGDKFKLNASIFARTEAVQTAAFTRFKLHCDWHFVPNRLLYSFWNEFYNSVFDGHTNYVKSTDNFSLPTYNLRNVVTNFENITHFGDLGSDAKKTFIEKVDEFGVPKIWNFRRLFDLFGYGTVGRYKSNSNTFNLTVPLLPFLAYHKIFYSHYNDSYWFKNDPSLYNVDSYHGTSLTDSQAAPIVSTMHYAPWKKDYIHNVLPSPTFNHTFINALPLDVSDSALMSSINKEPSDLNLKSPNVGTTVNAVGLINNDASTMPTTASDLRSLYALDRLKRVTGLAGSHYDEQIAAHFGVKLPVGLSNEAIFIGSQVVDLGISEVVASASTGAEGAGSTLGDIAGKGFANGSGKDINFTATEHGVIMCIFYIEPILDYSSQGIRPELRYRTSLDFYHPELDNIGMQPADANIISVRDLSNPKIYGWQYRYSELKTNIDVVNEGFYETSKSTWQTNFQQSLDDSNFNVLNTFSLCYIAPQFTNNIFLADFPRYSNLTSGVQAKYESNPNSGWANDFNSSRNIYENDNFLVAAQFKIFKTSIMSVHSMPQL